VKPHRRAQRIGAARDRRQRDAATAGAENDRRHHDVQAVETPGREEPRHRVRAALDQDAAEAARRERLEDVARRDGAAGCRQDDALDIVRELGQCTLRRHHDAAGAVGRKELGVGCHAAARIDHDARRAGARDVTHRQLRIVRNRGTDPDHDRIDQGTQPVQVGKPGRAVDVVRMTGLGRNAAVERLSELADHHQIIDRARPERPEALLPGSGQRFARPKHLWNPGPGINQRVSGRIGTRRLREVLALKPEPLRRKRSHYANNTAAREPTVTYG